MQGGWDPQPSTLNLQPGRLAGPRLALQAIQRAFGLLQGDAWNGLQVDHREQQSVEGLVLGGGSDSMAHGELGKKAAHLIGAELVRGPTVNKSLKLRYPKAVGSKSFW